MMDNHFIESSWSDSDCPFEIPLRPQALSEFIGQEHICRRLEILLTAAKDRKEPLAHCLFSGPPGLGKTTLAHILAKTMKTQLIVTSGPAVEKPTDLAGLLSNLKLGDFLFIDEIHRLSRIAEEYLYSAMEDFSLDLMIDTGANARSVQVKLHPFTLLGATTRSGLLSAPMRSRFGTHLRLDYYLPSDLQTIILRSAKLLQVSLDPSAAQMIAERSRGTPRNANNLLRWIRDYATAHRFSLVNEAVVQSAFEMISIDHAGLEEIDKKILTVIIDHHAGGPVGLNNLAAAVGEEPHTLAEVYEPYLILQGFLKRTPRGREVTHLAYRHMGHNPPKNRE